MAPFSSWKPMTSSSPLGGLLRNLRTIHMHLEGPGPIPVDDPEAAKCHWGATERGRWLVWMEYVSQGEILGWKPSKKHHRLNNMRISLQKMTQMIFSMFIISGVERRISIWIIPVGFPGDSRDSRSDRPCGERVHTPPDRKRKIIDSKVPLQRGYVLVPSKIICRFL